MELIEEVGRAEAKARERYWVETFRVQGVPLLNCRTARSEETVGGTYRLGDKLVARKRGRGRPEGKRFPRHKNLALTEQEFQVLMRLADKRGESASTVLRDALRAVARREGIDGV